MQDLIRPPPLRILKFEASDRHELGAGHTRSGSRVHLGTSAPFTQRLRHDTELGTNMTNRWLLSLILRQRLLEHPERTLPQLRRKLTGYNASSQRKRNQAQCESLLPLFETRQKNGQPYLRHQPERNYWANKTKKPGRWPNNL